MGIEVGIYDRREVRNEVIGLLGNDSNANDSHTDPEQDKLSMNWFRQMYQHLTDQQIWKKLKEKEIYLLAKSLHLNDPQVDSDTICQVFMQKFGLNVSLREITEDKRVEAALQRLETDILVAMGH